MKNVTILLILASLAVSCAQMRQHTTDPFAVGLGEADENPSQAIWDFDLLRDSKLITSVDLITLRGWLRPDPLGTIITSNTLVCDRAMCEIDKVFEDSTLWPHGEFLRLFDDYDPKREYGECLCSPKYVLAAFFYVETDQPIDPFGGNGSKERTRVAVALLDESHNSVLISDMKHGPRIYRFSVGHSPGGRVPKFIAKVMNGLGIEYEFLKR